MNHALQNEEPVELWHVEVAPNDVRVVTLEQLDEAFQRGLVNERTRVFQDGMDEPAYLGELLGLGDADEEEEEEEAPRHAAPAPSSRIHQNTLVGLAEPEPVRHRAPPPQAVTRSAPPPQAARSAPPPQAAARSAPPPMSADTYRAVTVSQRPRAAAPASAWPPVVQAPVAQRTAPPPPISVVAPSVVPLAMDLGDDLDDFPKPKRTGKILFLAVGTLAVAAGVGLAVTGQGASMLSSLTASASPAPAPVKAAAPVEAPKSHAYDPGDAPVKLKDAPPPLVLTTRENEASVLGSTTPTTPSTPDTTAKAGSTIGSKLAAAKAAVTKAFTGKRAKSGGGASKAPATASHAFKSGGGKSAIYDPLNGSL